MTNEAILKERQRCKDIVEGKIDRIIQYRIDKGRKRLIPTFTHLKDRLLFLIDNPDYKHHPDYSPRNKNT